MAADQARKAVFSVCGSVAGRTAARLGGACSWLRLMSGSIPSALAQRARTWRNHSRDRGAGAAGRAVPPGGASRMPRLRCSDGPPRCERLRAVMISATWVSACGKLPSAAWRPDRTLRPAVRRRCAVPSRRLNSALGFGMAPCKAQVVGEPERARQEEALRRAAAPSTSPHGCDSGATRPSTTRSRADRRQRAAHARVVGRQEADDRHQQQARVDFARAVVLDERVAPGVVALAANLARGSWRAAPASARRGPDRP